VGEAVGDKNGAAGHCVPWELERTGFSRPVGELIQRGATAFPQ
jgi:hypothetical protein